MGMSEFYGATDEAESIATLYRAELASTSSTSDVYGRSRTRSCSGARSSGAIGSC
jgi:hypothetical protein